MFLDEDADLDSGEGRSLRRVEVNVIPSESVGRYRCRPIVRRGVMSTALIRIEEDVFEVTSNRFQQKPQLTVVS